VEGVSLLKDCGVASVALDRVSRDIVLEEEREEVEALEDGVALDRFNCCTEAGVFPVVE